MVIEAAKLHFNDSGTPVSNQFDDIYYSTEDGMRETEYVFLDGNGLPQRWHNAEVENFVIGETGFGTGLNFLTTWWHHRQLRQKGHKLPRLHFVTFEMYPLSQKDLISALSRWPLLSDLAEQLAAQYPGILPGNHRLCFDDGQVVLDLWMGDIQTTLPQLFAAQQGQFDAWYLDGFAPSKNVGMWHPNVIKQIATLTKHNGTIATFTCARMVRDALQQAGFELSKRKGFGKKREMLMGVLNNPDDRTPSVPFHFRKRNNDKKNAAIIGGGIASAALAYALAKRGFDITLYCKDNKLAQGASQNRQGALYPLIHATYSPLSEFYGHAYTFALRQYQQLLAQGFHFDHDFCGVIVQTFDDKTLQRHQSLIRNGIWPDYLVKPLDPEQCSEVANLELPHSGLYFPQGGWINPASLIDAYLDAARSLTTIEIKLDCQVNALEQNTQAQWRVNEAHFDNVIICSGHLSGTFEQTQSLPLSPIRGQVSHLNGIEQTKSLSTVLCYSGYITPEKDGQHCIGASFIKGDSDTELRQREHERNLERLQAGVGNPDWFKQLETPTEGKASIRCASVDHLPLAGAVPDVAQYQRTYCHLYKGLKPSQYDLPPDYAGLYTLTGLGARGLCSGPLAAEILAAQMANEPYPVSNRVLDALNPGRSFIKQLKRQKPNLSES